MKGVHAASRDDHPIIYWVFTGLLGVVWLFLAVDRQHDRARPVAALADALSRRPRLADLEMSDPVLHLGQMSSSAAPVSPTISRDHRP